MIASKVGFYSVSELERKHAGEGKRYLEFLRIPSMSAGVYVLPVGATDAQKPHREDEIYYVLRGRGHFKAHAEDREVSAGSVIFVAAEVEHRFCDITEELAVLVLFAPAET